MPNKQEKHNTAITRNTNCNILKKIISCISNYIKQSYIEIQIGGDPILDRTVVKD